MPLPTRPDTQFVPCLGLVPRQHSSVGKHLLPGISKRDITYLRTLLIHGTHSLLWRAKKQTADLMGWLARAFSPTARSECCDGHPSG